MKNILIYIPNYPHFGGIESVTKVLLSYFVEKGYGVAVYSFNNDADHAPADQLVEGVRYVFAQHTHTHTHTHTPARLKAKQISGSWKNC